jgi:MFS superfamily sulfate permease-like transporter
MRPGDAVLGTLPGLKGHHSIQDFPDAATVPGLLLYRFNADIVFFNVDYFCGRVRAAIRQCAAPVRWVIVDLSPVNLVDATAVQRFGELREELAAQGITLGVARAKRQLGRAFEQPWLAENQARIPAFPTIRAAIEAFERSATAPRAES